MKMFPVISQVDLLHDVYHMLGCRVYLRHFIDVKFRERGEEMMSPDLRKFHLVEMHYKVA